MEQSATHVAVGAAFVLALVLLGASARELLSAPVFPESLTPPLVTAGLSALVLLLALATAQLAREGRALRAQQTELARLSLVAHRGDTAVFITDQEGLIEWTNEAFTRLSGHAAADAAGKAPGSLLLGSLPNLTLIQRLREAVTAGKPVAVEMLCPHRRGHRYWASLHLNPVLDPDGRAAHFVGVAHDITARKRAEEEFQRVHRRNELLLNAAGEGIFGLDPQGAITFVNPAAARLTGWEPGELIGRPASTLVHTLRVLHGAGSRDDLFTGAAFIDGTVNTGDSDEFRRRDGTAFPVEYTSTPLLENGSPAGSVVVFRDVTDRRQGEVFRARQARQFSLRAEVAFGLSQGESLRNFLHRSMQALVRHLDGAFARVWTLNAAEGVLELQASAGLYTHLNGSHARIPLGTFKPGRIAREGLPQISHNLITDPDIIDKEWVLRERMQSFLGFPLLVEGRVVGVMAVFSRNRLPDDAMELMASVADTIAQGTVRKRAEEKIAEQAALLDNSRDAIVVIDLQHRCSYWNRSAEALYGRTAAEMASQPADQLLFPDRAFFERARTLTLQRGEFSDTGSATGAGNRPVTVETRWNLIHDEEGRPRSILIVGTDVTEKKRIEQQFLRTQRMESIGTLAGGIAHDLNNVLSPIMMSVEMLKERFQDEPSRRMLGLLETSARRGAGLVRQVLTFARGVDGERALLQPKHLIKDIAKIIHDTFPRNITLKMHVPESLWPVLGDATQVHQVLLNLAVNARDAMPGGGLLTLTAENVVLAPGSEPPGSGLDAGAYTLIRVADTGTGIPRDILEKIWEPFFTTKETGKGTGLGLSTVLGIVKSHHGAILLDTEPGKGTRFSVYLPAQEHQAVAAEQEPRPLPAGRGQVILAVDDEAAVLSMTKATLEAFGYRVLTATDGAEALAAFTAHRGQIQGVLTDMMMPNMDGPSTIRVLQRLDPRVRIIATSGLMDAQRLHDQTGLEHIPLIQKPYTAEKLLTTLHSVLADAA
ncbi:MAG: hypothetical protein RJA22_2895 [Verrucomicrobiota bacterium]